MLLVFLTRLLSFFSAVSPTDIFQVLLFVLADEVSGEWPAVLGSLIPWECFIICIRWRYSKAHNCKERLQMVDELLKSTSVRKSTVAVCPTRICSEDTISSTVTITDLAAMAISRSCRGAEYLHVGALVGLLGVDDGHIRDNGLDSRELFFGKGAGHCVLYSSGPP